MNFIRQRRDTGDQQKASNIYKYQKNEYIWKKKWRWNIRRITINSYTSILWFLGDFKSNLTQEAGDLVSNITSAFHLNNSHLHLMVHWAGKNNPVVFVLARDQDLKIANPTSNFYISKDYGKNFEDVSDKFKLPSGANAVLEKFYNHPESPCYYVVTDTREKVSWDTKDFQI